MYDKFQYVQHLEQHIVVYVIQINNRLRFPEHWMKRMSEACTWEVSVVKIATMLVMKESETHMHISLQVSHSKYRHVTM